MTMTGTKGVGSSSGNRCVCALLLTLLLVGCGQSIHDTVERGDIARVTAMLDADPTLVNAKNYMDKRPLHFAVTVMDDAAIALLLDRGADINAVDKTGLTPLHVAAILGFPSQVNLLLERDASIDARDQFGDTPLHSAAIHGNLPAIELLVDWGADVFAKNNEGLSPRDLADRYGNTQAVSLLSDIEQELM